MRSVFPRAILLGALGAACAVGVACAADVPSDRSAVGNPGYYSAYGTRIEPVVIYDTQPGVIGRSYWYAPWANRHYFPKTGRRPKVGRREHIPTRRMSKAEDHFRFWSASSVFFPEIPVGPTPRFGIPPAPSTEQP